MVTFLTNKDTKLTQDKTVGLVEKKQIDILSFIGKIEDTRVAPYTNSDGKLVISYNSDTAYYTTDFIYVPKGENLYLKGKFKAFVVFNAQKELLDELVCSGEIGNNLYIEYLYTAEFDQYVQFSIYDHATQNPVTITSSYYCCFEDGVRLNAEQIAQAREELIGGCEYRNMLTGKKWVACGDSFTAGINHESQEVFENGLYSGKNKVYPYYIGRRCGMNVVNEAKAGSTMAHREDGTVLSFTGEFTSGCRYKSPEFDDADYITLKFGINDNSHGLPVGTIDDTTINTFYGAWNVALEYLLTNHPTAHIGIIVTNGLVAYGSDVYVNATIAVAEKWGVPYLNLATGTQSPIVFKSNKSTETVRNAKRSAFVIGDNYHPNALAHEYESRFIESWLMTI